MPAKPVFTVIGGDKRLYYLAQELLHTNPVICCGTAETPDGAVCAGRLPDAALGGDILVFPMPFSPDGENIPASSPITVEEAIRAVLPKHRHVFGGRLPEELKARCRELNVPFSDWMEMETVSLPNAILTAEGTVLEALRHSPDGLYRTKAAVLGYGRCGKAAAVRLKSLCQQVTVYARNPIQRMEAEMAGVCGEPLEMLPEQVERYGLLVNTIPSMVLPGDISSCLSSDALVLDIASGKLADHIDIPSTQDLGSGVQAIICPGLPGKHFPRAAGRILAHGCLTHLKLFP